MAFIYIKKRENPVFLKDDLARQLKKDWISKIDKNEIVNLGEWAGTYNDIKSIEIPSDKHQEEINETEIQQVKDELENYRIDRVHFTLGFPMRHLTCGGIFKYYFDKGLISCESEILPEMKTMSDLPEWKMIKENIFLFIHYEKILDIVSQRVAEERRIKWAGGETYDELIAKAVA